MTISVRPLLSLLQQVPAISSRRKDLHLMNGDFVQTLQTLRLRNAVLNHHRVEVLHVGDADQLVDVRIIPLVALEVRLERQCLLH